MNSPESDQTIFMTRSAGLARIFSLDDADRDLWGPEEMEAMWQHQLSAPIDVDLDSVVSVSATQLPNQLMIGQESSPFELLRVNGHKIGQRGLPAVTDKTSL